MALLREGQQYNKLSARDIAMLASAMRRDENEIISDKLASFSENSDGQIGVLSKVPREEFAPQQDMSANTIAQDPELLGSILHEALPYYIQMLEPGVEAYPEGDSLLLVNAAHFLDIPDTYQSRIAKATFATDLIKTHQVQDTEESLSQIPNHPGFAQSA